MITAVLFGQSMAYRRRLLPLRFSLLALLQIWQAAIYVIWHEGNARMHSGLTISHDAVADKATALADDKCRAMTSLGSLLGPLLLNVWMS
ncbi:hypothetical protein Bca101_091689 [Brassica carinata]